jgi:hypothetical protein
MSLMNQSAMKDPPYQPHISSNERKVAGADGESMKARLIAEQMVEINGLRDLRETSDSFGRISIEGEQPNYVGAAHWAAILDSVGPECSPFLKNKD